MTFFVCPKDPNRTINLEVTKSITRLNERIHFDETYWVYENNKQAKEVYEAIIKLGQQNRYRHR